MTDYEEIQVLPTGVYRVRFRQLNPREIKSLRTRTKKRLQELKARQNRLIISMDDIEAEVMDTQRLLNEEHNPAVDAYLQRWESMQAEANQHAESFLKDFLGEEGYNKFRKAGFLSLSDAIGESWRVYADGTAMRLENGAYRRVCVLRQKELPLPDHIVSVIQTIKERPGRLRNDGR